MGKNRIMTENEKLNKVIELFQKIQELFPEGHCELNIYGVDLKSIDRNLWNIEANFLEDTLEPYLVAKNYSGDTYFGITLYGKEQDD